MIQASNNMPQNQRRWKINKESWFQFHAVMASRGSIPRDICTNDKRDFWRDEAAKRKLSKTYYS